MHSLKSLLEYAGDDLEDVFGMTFRIGYQDVFGNALTHDLKAEGDSITVTQENKQVRDVFYLIFSYCKCLIEEICV